MEDRSRPAESSRGVSTWMLFILVAAGAGAIVVWSTAGKTKHTSETLLHEYGKLLAQAREEMNQPDEEEDGKASPENPRPGASR